MRRRILLLLAILMAAPVLARPRAPVVHVPEKAKNVVRAARAFLPEENPKAKSPKDCSDFVRKVFARNGMNLPRTAVEMSTLGERVKSTKSLRMGDLLFFSGEKVSRIVGHVAIYVNNGIFIHVAQRQLGARMESLYSDYYRKRYITARRLIP